MALAYVIKDEDIGKGCAGCDLFTGVRCYPVNRKPEYNDVMNRRTPSWCPLQEVSIEED